MISWWIALLICLYGSIGGGIAIGFLIDSGFDSLGQVFLVGFLVYFFWIFILIWMGLVGVKDVIFRQIGEYKEKRDQKKKDKKEDEEYDEQYDDERLIRLGINDTNDIWSSREI